MSQDDRRPRATQPTLLQRILGTRLVTGAGIRLSQIVPPFAGHAVGALIACLINWLRPAVYWVVYANLRQVVGDGTSAGELHRLTRQVFHGNARNNYDLWRAVGRGPEQIKTAAVIPPEVWARIDQALERGKGAIIVGTHTGNFDLGIMALAAHGREVQILGLAAPPGGGFDLMDKLRARTGANLTSINPQSLREAIRRLRAGGLILTGVDRPVDEGEAKVEFFGKPARLPTGHVRLALKTDAAILVAGPHYCPEQRRTVVDMSPALEMEYTGDQETDLQTNLRHVTAWLEKFIRTQPEQWAMFLPVWPQQDSPQKEAT